MMAVLHYVVCNSWLVHGQNALAHSPPHMFDLIVRSLYRHPNYFRLESDYLFQSSIYVGVSGCNRSVTTREIERETCEQTWNPIFQILIKSLGQSVPSLPRQIFKIIFGYSEREKNEVKTDFPLASSIENEYSIHAFMHCTCGFNREEIIIRINADASFAFAKTRIHF